MITNMVYSGTKRRFPNVKIISTHGGGTMPYLARRIGMLAEFLASETASSRRQKKCAPIQDLLFDLTACTTPNAMPAILDLVPSSQLMIGFDWPMMHNTHQTCSNFIRTTPLLSDADRTAIFGGTAVKLFSRICAKNCK